MRETYVGDYQVVVRKACRPGNAGILAKLLCDSVLRFTVLNKAQQKPSLASEGRLFSCIMHFADYQCFMVESCRPGNAGV